MRPIHDIFPELQTPKKIVVTMHLKPDGDAMGSSLGLYNFLIQLGHEVVVISPTNWPKFLAWMPGVADVIDYERNKEAADEKLLAAEWIFCLDFNVLSRTKDMETALQEATGKRILIDHHELPQVASFDYGISTPAKSSTAEMVFDFIRESGFEDKINEAVAECLYTGLVTDTGSFRFPATTASVHTMVGALKERGLDHTKIHESISDNGTENRLRFIGNALLNRMEVFYEYNTALIAIPASDVMKFNITTGDTEGLVNYPLGIEGIKFAAIVIDRGELRKFSFRSKGDFDVNEFARENFEGGGHKNAAGGQSTDSFEKAVDRFKQSMYAKKSTLSSYTF
jgi:phosphoesterase RecJ-like protein